MWCEIWRKYTFISFSRILILLLIHEFLALNCFPWNLFAFAKLSTRPVLFHSSSINMLMISVTVESVQEFQTNLFSVKIFFTFFNYKFLLLIKISSFFPPRFIIRNIWSDEDLFPVRKNQKRIWTMIRRTTKSKYASASAKVIIVFSEKNESVKTDRTKVNISDTF
jgi:hypothetical protein